MPRKRPVVTSRDPMGAFLVQLFQKVVNEAGLTEQQVEKMIKNRDMVKKRFAHTVQTTSTLQIAPNNRRHPMSASSAA